MGNGRSLAKTSSGQTNKQTNERTGRRRRRRRRRRRKLSLLLFDSHRGVTPSECPEGLGHICSGQRECNRKNGFETRRGSNFRPFSFGSSRFNVQTDAQNGATTQFESQRGLYNNVNVGRGRYSLNDRHVFHGLSFRVGDCSSCGVDL
jgi:hypothetical protein